MSEPTAGSAADLSRRMDGLEMRQAHAEELNKLRFGSLEASVASLASDLKLFMVRIEAVLSGELDTNATRQTRNERAEWQDWRRAVDSDRTRIAAVDLDQVEKDREAFAVLQGQLNQLGRIALILVGGNALAIVAAVYAIIQSQGIR
jgi:hypothetical protein